MKQWTEKALLSLTKKKNKSYETFFFSKEF